MGRILAVDYGLKRVGLAITDTSNIIASGLDTVAANEIYVYLQKLIAKENISCIVVGEPKNLQNEATNATKPADTFTKKITKLFPEIKIERMDERFTSKMAFQAMIDGGMSKKNRREKGAIDKVSATIILQEYMNKISR